MPSSVIGPTARDLATCSSSGPTASSAVARRGRTRRPPTQFSSRHAGGPAGHDGGTQSCGNEIDDRLLFVGDFGDARRQLCSLKQFDGQVVTVWARAAIGTMSGWSAMSTSETDVRRAFRWANKCKVECARKDFRQGPDGFVLQQLNGDVRMSVVDIRQELREQPRRRAVDRANFEAPPSLGVRARRREASPHSLSGTPPASFGRKAAFRGLVATVGYAGRARTGASEDAAPRGHASRFVRTTNLFERLFVEERRRLQRITPVNLPVMLPTPSVTGLFDLKSPSRKHHNDALDRPERAKRPDHIDRPVPIPPSAANACRRP